MAKFCTSCGKELQDGVMFCTGCGTKVSENLPLESSAPATENVIPVHEVKAEPIAVQTEPKKQPQQTENHRVTTAHFFWMMLVYSLPLIGWLICIIMAFAPKNESKKHFARAILIWGLIGIIISVIGLVILSLLGGGIAEILSEIQY